MIINKNLIININLVIIIKFNIKNFLLVLWIEMEIKLLDLELMGFKGDIASYILFTDKYYILIESGPRATINNLQEKLMGLGVKLEELDFIIVTHIHLDHAGGAGNIIRKTNNPKILVHPRGFQHLHEPNKLWISSRNVLGETADLYGPPLPIPRSRLIAVSDGTDLDVGDDALIFIHSPGHSSHHMVIYLVEEKTLFSGDTLGIHHNGIHMPNTPKPHNYDLAVNSIKKLLKLDVNTVYFTHFGGFKPGNKAIEIALNRWKLWYNILWEAYRDELSVKESYRLLLKKDEHAKKMDEYFRSRPYEKDELLININGFLSYFKWKYEG